MDKQTDGRMNEKLNSRSRIWKFVYWNIWILQTQNWRRKYLADLSSWPVVMKDFKCCQCQNINVYSGLRQWDLNVKYCCSMLKKLLRLGNFCWQQSMWMLLAFPLRMTASDFKDKEVGLYSVWIYWTYIWEKWWPALAILIVDIQNNCLPNLSPLISRTQLGGDSGRKLNWNFACVHIEIHCVTLCPHRNPTLILSSKSTNVAQYTKITYKFHQNYI